MAFSLLPVPGKILEKIVHNHIIKYQQYTS